MSLSNTSTGPVWEGTGSNQNGSGSSGGAGFLEELEPF
jgi:hypothetical protein